MLKQVGCSKREQKKKWQKHLYFVREQRAKAMCAGELKGFTGLHRGLTRYRHHPSERESLKPKIVKCADEISGKFMVEDWKKEGVWDPCFQELFDAFKYQDRRLATVDQPSGAHPILAAFLLLFMVLVYLFSHLIRAPRHKPYGTRIVRKKPPTRIVRDF